MSRLRWIAVLAVALAPVGLARAQSVVTFGGPSGTSIVSVRTISTLITGQLVVSFHGDPATGCAAHGLCAYSGTVVLRPGRPTINVVQSRRGRSFGYQVLFQPGFSSQTAMTFAHVERTGANGPAGLCGDVQEPNQLFTAQSRGSLVTLSLIGRRTSILSTRCAGPLDADVAAESPSVTVSVKALRAGRRVLSLQGTHDFAANGFAGTLASTIVIHLGAAREAGVPHPTTGGKGQRLRTVTETLSLVRQSGQLVTVVAGSANPFLCQPLDTCGSSGMIVVQPKLIRVRATLSASGPASLPYRDFLAALGLSRGGNPRSIFVGGSVQWVDAGQVRADMTQDGSCSDSAPLGAGALALFGQGQSLSAIYETPGNLRTRCPGPTPNLSYLAPALARHALGRRTIVLDLRPRSSLTDDGYLGSTHGALRLVLRRVRLTQRVSVVPTG